MKHSLGKMRLGMIAGLIAIAGAMALAGTVRAAETRWVKYVDPQEHAFSIDVPAGWRAQGGLRRMGQLDIRQGVDIASPDGAIRIFLGDVNVPVFTTPSRLLAFGGLRQGMITDQGFGLRELIWPYQDGEAFAAQWGSRRVGRACSGVQRTGARPRPDASRGIDRAFAAAGVRDSVRAGEANFACSLQARRRWATPSPLPSWCRPRGLR